MTDQKTCHPSSTPVSADRSCIPWLSRVAMLSDIASFAHASLYGEKTRYVCYTPTGCSHFLHKPCPFIDKEADARSRPEKKPRLVSDVPDDRVQVEGFGRFSLISFLIMSTYLLLQISSDSAQTEQTLITVCHSIKLTGEKLYLKNIVSYTMMGLLMLRMMTRSVATFFQRNRIPSSGAIGETFSFVQTISGYTMP